MSNINKKSPAFLLKTYQMLEVIRPSSRIQNMRKPYIGMTLKTGLWLLMQTILHNKYYLYILSIKTCLLI